MQQLEDTAFLPDPTSQVSRVVVQHNALAEAHYRLSLRAQKLLIRLIAELDQQSVELSEITLSLVDFAVLAAQERNDVTFAHFCDAAEQFLGRFVAIAQPPIAGEERSCRFDGRRHAFAARNSLVLERHPRSLRVHCLPLPPLPVLPTVHASRVIADAGQRAGQSTL